MDERKIWKKNFTKKFLKNVKFLTSEKISMTSYKKSPQMTTEITTTGLTTNFKLAFGQKIFF